MEIIKLNLIPSGVNSICHCSQYDNGRVIRLELFDGLTPYTLQSGDTVTLNVRKPDNTIVTASVTATQGNNYVDIVTTEQMCAVVGNNLCDLTITNGSVVIGTLNFYMQIERDVLADGIASQSVIEDLDALVAEATEPFLTDLADTVSVTDDNFYTKTIYEPSDLTVGGRWIDTSDHLFATLYTESAYSHIEIDINAGDKIIISTIVPSTVANYYLISTNAYTSNKKIISKNVSDNTALVKAVVDIPFNTNANKLFVNCLTSAANTHFEITHYKTTEKLRTLQNNANFTSYNKPYIKNGEVCCNKINDSRTAYYTGVDCGYCAKPSKLTSKFKFEKNTSTSGSVALIFNPNGVIKVSNITNKSLHFVMNNTGYVINLFNNGSDVGPLKTSSFEYPIPLNNTEVTVILEITSDTTMTIDIYYKTEYDVDIHISESATIASGSLYDYAGRYVTFEHYCNGNMDDFSMPKFTYFKVEGNGFITIVDDFKRENGLLNVTPSGIPYVLLTNETLDPEYYTQDNPYFRKIVAAANCELISGGHIQNGHIITVQANVKATSNSYMTLYIPKPATNIVVAAYASDGSTIIGYCNSDVNLVFAGTTANKTYCLLFSYVSKE